MDESKRLSSVAANSLTKPASSNLQRVLEARMMLSEAIDAATAIIAGYPNGGANAGDSYIGALASTLMGYPRQVALRCADYPRKPGKPLRGISATSKFLPTPADIIAWCERDAAPLHRDRQYELRTARQLEERAEFEAPRTSRLNYDELKAKYGDREGGWGIDRASKASGHKWLTADDLAAIVGREEFDKIPNRKAAE